MKAPFLFAVSAPGEHTAAPHADSEDAAPPSAPSPTDFHTRCARIGPPENKVDRPGRIRFPLLKIRPNAGVHKSHQAFRSLGPVHLSAPLDFAASPQTSRHVVASSPTTSAFSVAGVAVSLPTSHDWLTQSDARRE